MKTDRMYIGLGGNLGDREALLDAALAQMAMAWGSPVAVSPRYETPAWGMAAGTPAFLNQVVAHVMPMGVRPEQVLDFLLEVERDLGRERDEAVEAYQNRTVDCDLLLIEGHTAPHKTARLTVPHPRLAARRFVLQPLADIAPDVVVPGWEMTVTTLLDQCEDDAELTLFASAHA